MHAAVRMAFLVCSQATCSVALLLNALRMWTVLANAASHVLAPAGDCTSKSLTVRVNPCVPVSNDTCYHRISPR